MAFVNPDPSKFTYDPYLSSVRMADVSVGDPLAVVPSSKCLVDKGLTYRYYGNNADGTAATSDTDWTVRRYTISSGLWERATGAWDSRTSLTYV